MTHVTLPKSNFHDCFRPDQDSCGPTGKVNLYFLTLLLSDCSSLHCITELLEGLAASGCLLWAQPNVDYSQEAQEQIHQQTVVISDAIAATKDILLGPVFMSSMS